MPIATDTLLLGPVTVEAGEEIPETYPAPDGSKQKTDFDRLEELGLIADDSDDSDDEGDLSKLTVKQLRALAAEAEIDVPADAKKDDLVELLEEHADEEPET